MRDHEVPTHLGTEDKVLLGFTFPQIVAAASVVGLAYGVWSHATFLPPGAPRVVVALLIAVLGLTGIAVRPDGRSLPGILLSMLRFALTPKRFEGRIEDLLHPKPQDPTPTKGRRRLRGFRLSLPFRCVSIVLAAALLMTSMAPRVAHAAPARQVDELQRLFIQRWSVQEGQATIALRAATALEVRVSGEQADGAVSFQARDVLYQGETRKYAIPLTASHQAIVITWRDALGNAGIVVLDGSNFPYPLPQLTGQDCLIRLARVTWEQGGPATGTISTDCNDFASEVVEATVLEAPDDPTQTVHQRLLVDAAVENVSGSLHLATGSAADQVALVRGSTRAFNLAIPVGADVHSVTVNAELDSSHIGEIPGRVDLVKHEEETQTVTTRVVAWFEGFVTRVTSVLRAVWDPFVRTVSATLSAWFEPITRTLSATLQATWDGFTQVVGAVVSTTVGMLVSAIVGTQVWATVGTWLTKTVGTIVSTTVEMLLTRTVGTIVSATVGTWLTKTVGTWVSTMVGGFYTTVTKWVNVVLGWLNIKVWVPEEEASGYASGEASGYATGTASGYASGTASGYASGEASGYASGTASGYASKTASGYASGEASGYADGVASSYASTEVAVEGKTASRTVSESVTVLGQTEEQTISEDVWVSGRTAEQEVSEDVWTPGKQVEQDVDVEVVIPGYTSAEVGKPQPLVRRYSEQLSGSFALLTDAPYEPVPEPRDDRAGDDQPSQIEQYIDLIDDQPTEDDGGDDEEKNPFEDAIDGIDDNPYFIDRPDEAARLRSLLFLAWIDTLTVPIEARRAMEDEAGAVASGKRLGTADLSGDGIGGQDLFRSLTGAELR